MTCRQITTGRPRSRARQPPRDGIDDSDRRAGGGLNRPRACHGLGRDRFKAASCSGMAALVQHWSKTAARRLSEGSWKSIQP